LGAGQSMAVYHRLLDRNDPEFDRGLASGQIRGAAPRNIIASDFAQVLAYHGPLPAGRIGYQFETSVQPDPYHPAIARRIAGNKGVGYVYDSTPMAVIDVTILKMVRK